MSLSCVTGAIELMEYRRPGWTSRSREEIPASPEVRQRGNDIHGAHGACADPESGKVARPAQYLRAKQRGAVGLEPLGQEDRDQSTQCVSAAARGHQHVGRRPPLEASGTSGVPGAVSAAPAPAAIAARMNVRRLT